jgi:hypothetical protein
MFLRPTELGDGDLSVAHREKSGDFASIEPLIELCKFGRLYEVEAWIAAGRPVQCEPPEDPKLRKRPTPLQIAVAKGFHSLTALLLANGYDPDGDYYDCWGPAIRARDHGMVDLLLRFGADPNTADFGEVLETYDRGLMDRFIAAGVDPCAENAVARALRHKGRPLLGFVKTYRERFPALQRQIDIALLGFVDERDEKGIALMLWLDADPFAIVPHSPYSCDAEATDYESAFECSLSRCSEEIIEKFLRRPIPPDRVKELFRTVAYRCQPVATRRLLEVGSDPNDLEENQHVLRSFITALTWNIFGLDRVRDARGLEALEIVLAAGARWDISKPEIAYLRRSLLGGDAKTVARIIALLDQYGGFSKEQIAELTRTPAMKKLLSGERMPKKVPLYERLYASPVTSSEQQPNRYWKRHWFQR